MVSPHRNSSLCARRQYNGNGNRPFRPKASRSPSKVTENVLLTNNAMIGIVSQPTGSQSALPGRATTSCRKVSPCVRAAYMIQQLDNNLPYLAQRRTLCSTVIQSATRISYTRGHIHEYTILNDSPLEPRSVSMYPTLIAAAACIDNTNISQQITSSHMTANYNYVCCKIWILRIYKSYRKG